MMIGHVPDKQASALKGDRHKGQAAMGGQSADSGLRILACGIGTLQRAARKAD
jgi:hypothetical protein